MGAPARFNLVELGPGLGTLMADIARTAKVVPAFMAAASIHLVETSPLLRAAQKKALTFPVAWHDGFSAVPEGPAIIVANEFFDALPIRQFERRGGRWMERVIGVVGDKLSIGLVESDAVAEQGAPGDIIEFAPARSDIATETGARLARHAGAALIIDYGHLATARGDTLQALRRHKRVAITDSPGHCDLTSHVDFEALGKALRQGGANVWPAMTQRSFLLAMGLEARTAALSAKTDQRTREVLQRAMTRLADGAEMGNLFKVLAATSQGLAAPYPFGGT